MARTATLPGVADERNVELNSLANQYCEWRDERMARLKKEVEVKHELIAAMQALGLTSYHDDEADLTITLETKTKVKVKIGSEEEDDDAE